MQENRIKITWYGTASVRITIGSSQLLIDPFFPFSDSSVKVPADAYDGCSNILVSHGHFDHIGSIKEIVRDDTAVYCTKAPYQTLCRKGVSENNLHLISTGDVFSIGKFRITAYNGKHIKLSAWDCIKKAFSKRIMQNRKGICGKLKKITSCLEKKETLCYLIEACGKRILVLGSLALADNVNYPTDADIAFFPYQYSDDIFSIASSVFEKLKPKAVLLTHFDDTFPPFSTETDTSEIEEQLKRYAAVYKLRNGGSVEI